MREPTAFLRGSKAMLPYRAIIVSLDTYTAPFNDGKLKELGRLGVETLAVAGDVQTLWPVRGTSRREAEYGVEVLPTRFGSSPATTCLVGLRGLLRNYAPNVVHIEAEPWQRVAVQACRFAMTSGTLFGVQFAENGPQLRGAAGAARRRIATHVLRSCEYVVGWSSESALVARRLAPGKAVATFPATGVSSSRLHPSAQPDRWFSRMNDGGLKLAFAGRLAVEKGVQDVLRVADEVARHTSVRVAVAGSGPLESLVRSWTADRPWARFHRVLPRDATQELLGLADVVLCPSRTMPHVKEQFGKAAVEAMALGTPVYAYACGALQEVIGDGGVVVPEGDCDALISAILAYANSSSVKRDELSRRARDRAEQFTDEAIARQLVSIWETQAARGVGDKCGS